MRVIWLVLLVACKPSGQSLAVTADIHNQATTSQAITALSDALGCNAFAEGWPVLVRNGRTPSGVAGYFARYEIVLAPRDEAMRGVYTIHELGHALGLSHVDDECNVMSPAPCWITLALAARDIARLADKQNLNPCTNGSMEQ